MDLYSIKKQLRSKKSQAISNDTANNNVPVKSGASSSVSLDDCSYNYERGSNVVSFSCSKLENLEKESTGQLSLICWFSEKPRKDCKWQNDNNCLIGEKQLTALKEGGYLLDVNHTFEIPEDVKKIIDDSNDLYDDWCFVFTVNELHEDGYNYIIHTINGPNENEPIPISDPSLSTVELGNHQFTFQGEEKFSGKLQSSDKRCIFYFHEGLWFNLILFHTNGIVAASIVPPEEDDEYADEADEEYNKFYDEDGNEISGELFEQKYPEFEQICEKADQEFN